MILSPHVTVNWLLLFGWAATKSVMPFGEIKTVKALFGKLSGYDISAECVEPT